MTGPRRHTLSVVAILAVHLSLLGICAAFRNSIFDEGVYMNAARLMHDGSSVYKDFFFPQLMLLPMITSILAEGGWLSFWMLRGLAVAAGLVSATMVYVIAYRLTKNQVSSLVALSVYALSGLMISWHAIYTAQVFAHMLSLISLLLWLKYFESKRTGYLVLTAVTLSVLFNLRATFIVLVPLYLISFVLFEPRSAWKNIGLFVGAMVPVSLVTIVKFLNAPGNFIFDTLRFQLLREGNNQIGHILLNKMTIILRVLVDPHILLIVLAAVFAVATLVRQNRIKGVRSLFVSAEGMVLMNLLLIAGVYLVPNPMMRQYTEQYLAFAIILGATAVPTIWNWIAQSGDVMRKYIAPTALTLVIAGSLVPYWAVYIFDSRQQDRMYLLDEIRGVVDAMQECRNLPGPVVTEWPGYAFLAKSPQLARSEILGWQWNLPLTAEEFQKYRLCDNNYLRQSVIDRTPSQIINVTKTPEAYADIINDGYVATHQAAGVTLFCRK